MSYQPIEITEAHVRAFAQKAAELDRTLDREGRALWSDLMSRAGGDTGHPNTVDSEPSTGRFGSIEESAGAQGPGGANSHKDDAERFATILAGVWEPGTTIAPLYSGDMPEEGTID